MRRYLLHRTLLLVPVLLGVSVIVFLALHLAPGDPAQVLLGPLATPSELTTLRRQLGLDQPLPLQYLVWIGRFVQGDWGTSIALHEPVRSLVGPRLANTLILAVPAFVLATVTGLVAGVVAARWRRSPLDAGVSVGAFTLLSMPAYWLGLILVIVFSLRIGNLPSGGMYTAGGAEDFGDLLAHLILPCVTLAAAPAAIIAQVTRSAVGDELGLAYVRTARAKGAGGWRVLLSHATRNALIPIVTTLGLEINYIIGGDVLVENIFSWPGIGQLLVQSVFSRDYPIVLGSTLALATIFVLVNLVVDGLYSVLDPRISTSA